MGVKFNLDKEQILIKGPKAKVPVVVTVIQNMITQIENSITTVIIENKL